MFSIIFLALAYRALASPLNKRIETCNVNASNNKVPAACNAADPPFTQNERSMFANINCQNSGGINVVKKPFLLVPGTGTTGAQSFQGGYVELLGANGLGFDVCFLSEPLQMLEDAQDVGERIAYAINTLASISGTSVAVAGWSQGNLDIQWALTFWTSSRTNTRQFISLAGDFRGSNIADLFGIDLAAGIAIPPSLKQQLAGSNFLKGLSKHNGLAAKVPTTSIFSLTDEVIQPESTSTSSTSFLSGSNVGNILIQSACPGLDVSHEDELFINFTFQVVKMALASSANFVTSDQVAAANVPCNVAAAPGADPNLGKEAIADATAAIIVAEDELRGVFIEPPVRSFAA